MQYNTTHSIVRANIHFSFLVVFLELIWLTVAQEVVPEGPSRVHRVDVPVLRGGRTRSHKIDVPTMVTRYIYPLSQDGCTRVHKVDAPVVTR